MINSIISVVAVSFAVFFYGQYKKNRELYLQAKKENAELERKKSLLLAYIKGYSIKAKVLPKPKVIVMKYMGVYSEN